jgi:hypothetical protein
MSLVKYIIVFILSSFLIGCASNQDLPLVFGQSQTVGISIGAGASEQGADFVLGYKDKNVAIVPVSIKDKDGSTAQIASKSGANFGVCQTSCRDHYVMHSQP